MRDPRSQPDPLDDPHNPPPWSLWEAFSETIVELASAAMTPTPTALAPEQSLPPPKRITEIPAPLPPEQPQHTPGVPSPLASTAARHPYSTAFLMGAALTASCLLGAAGARAAFGQPVRSHAGSTVSRTMRRGSSNGCTAGGSGSSAVVTRLGADVEARFSRLEEAVRSAQAGQARIAEQVQGVPQLAARIGSLQMKLDVDAKRLDRTMQGLAERKSNDHVLEHVQSDIDSRVQQLGVELTAAAEKARQVRSTDSGGGGAELMAQSQKDMSASLARKMKEDMQQLLSRLDEVESSLGAVSAGLNRFKGHPVVNESVAPEIDTEPNPTPAAPDTDATTAHVEVEQSTQAAVHHDDGNPDVDHVSATTPRSEAATAKGVESTPASVDRVQDPSMDAEKDSALLNATQGQFALPRDKAKETVKDTQAQDRAADPVSSSTSSPTTGESERTTSASAPTPEADQAPTTSSSAGDLDGAASTSASAAELDGGAASTSVPNVEPESDTETIRASSTINHPFDTTIKSAQPVKRLGINDTGEWKFSLEPDRDDPASGSGVRRKFILLTRHAHKSSLGRYMPIWSMNMTFAIGPFATAVVFSPEVDMVLLDGAWWRCSREREIYTIREKVADDA